MDEILIKYRDNALEAIKGILDEELEADLKCLELKVIITPGKVIASCVKEQTRIVDLEVINENESYNAKTDSKAQADTRNRF